MKRCRGFTLIELMIVVAVIGILAAIAIPNYSDYVTRGRIPGATTVLSDMRVKMEQYFQDNRDYTNACVAVVIPPTDNENFDFSCGVPTLAGYTLTATGKARMAGFNYSITQANAKSSPFSGAPSGWVAHTPDNCWVISKGGGC